MTLAAKVPIAQMDENCRFKNGRVPIKYTVDEFYPLKMRKSKGLKGFR